MSAANIRAGLATAAKLGRDHYVAAGKKGGRKRTRAPITFICKQCGVEFSRKVVPAHLTYEFCSVKCHLTNQRDLRRKLPKDDAERRTLLMDLYVWQRLTTVEIAKRFGMNHKSVISAMKLLGISRRKVGESRHVMCCEPDCNLPVFKVRHKTNCALYGRRCRLHWIVFRMMVNQRYNDKHLGKDDEAWLRKLRQLLARAIRLNHEVSRSLNQESPQATSSLHACPR